MVADYATRKAEWKAKKQAAQAAEEQGDNNATQVYEVETAPLAIKKGPKQNPGHRVVIYGPGAIGKSSLAALLSQVGIEPVFIDVEDGTTFLDVSRIDPAPATYMEVLAAIPVAAGLGDAVVIDSLTRVEEMVVEHCLATIPAKSGKATKFEDYGYDGCGIALGQFLLLLQRLDAVIRQGKHVVCIAHDCVDKAPNPAGTDWIRFEPRLQAPTGGRASIRLRVREWCDHLLYICYEVDVKGGRGTGSGIRTIWPYELPTWLAKSRTLTKCVTYRKGNPELWERLLGMKEESDD